MNLDTAALRRLYAQENVPSSEEECPTTSALATAAQGPVPDELAHHLERCSPCAEAYQLARALFQELTPQRQDARGPKKTYAQWRVFLLAACLATVAFVIPWALKPTPPLDQHRGELGEWETVLPTDGAFLEHPPIYFSWEVRYPGESYRVEVFDSELTPLWASSLLEESRVELPSAVRDGMAPGALFFWRVTFLNRAQKAQSPLMAFTLQKDKSD